MEKCGCYVSNVEADFGPEIVFCPMHKAAEQVLTALQRMVDLYPAEYTVELAKAAIDVARGE